MHVGWQVKPLAKLLKFSRNLQRLSLEFNELGVQGIKWLAKGISASQSIESINVKGNMIGDEGMVAGGMVWPAHEAERKAQGAREVPQGVVRDAARAVEEGEPSAFAVQAALCVLSSARRSSGKGTPSRPSVGW